MITNSSFRFLLSVYGLLGLGSAAHLAVRLGHLDLPGPAKLWLSMAWTYWVALSFLLAQVGLGSLLYRIPWLRACRPTGLPALPFFLGAGFYGSFILLILLGLPNGVGPWRLALYLPAAVPMIFFGWARVKEVISELSSLKSGRPVPNFSGRRFLIVMAVFLALAWIAPILVQSLLPNTDWDGAWHHLPLARQYLSEGITPVDPGFEQYNYPGSIHLAYSLFFTLGAVGAVIPLNLLTALALVLAVYSLAARFWGRKGGLWSAAVMAGTNILWEVALTPRIDVFLSFFCFLAFFAFLLWLQEKEKGGHLAVMGMMLGAALGIKYTAGFFVVLLVPLASAADFFTGGRRVRSTLPLLAMMIIPMLIPSGWWYARNAFSLGDPLYPFITGKVYYDREGERRSLDEGIKYLSAEMPPRAEMEKLFGRAGLGSLMETEAPSKRTRSLLNLYDVIRNPESYQRKPHHEINPLLLLFLVLPVFRRDPLSWWLYGLGGGVFALIAWNTYLLRYTLPVLPLWAVGAALVLSRIDFRSVLAVACVVAALVWLRVGLSEWSKLRELRPVAYLSGGEERLDWLCSVGYNGATSTPRLIRFINRLVDEGRLSEEEQVFMIGEGKGNLLETGYQPDSSRAGDTWLEELVKNKSDYHSIARDFRERGINYLVVNYGYFQWVAREVPLDRKLLHLSLYHLQLFMEKHARIIYDREAIILARLR